MKDKTSKPFYKQKRYLTPLIIAILLIAFRLYLPTLVKNHVNKTLAQLTGYYGQVADIDIALIRGAYVIKGMYLNTVEGTSQVPFLNFPKTDISVEWKSLFKGSIVSEIIMFDPEVIYVFEDQEANDAADNTDIETWTKVLTDLVPIDINHFEAHRAKVAFVQLQADPNIDLQIHSINLTADNLRNVVEKERVLPSTVTATGQSIGQGAVKLDGRVNLIKEIPDMDISFSLENADATSLNDFTDHYAKIDFEEGLFHVYAEIAIADGFLKGYVKPMLSDAKYIGKEDSFLEVLWEGFTGLFRFILKNQGTNTLATKVPLEGDLNNVKTKIWPTIFNIFENAWIKAFSTSVDDDIEYEDAFQDEELSRKEKRKRRQEDRDRKKEIDD